MPLITVDVPEEAFAALRRSPAEFAPEMCLAAAIHWYSRGEISQERAGEIAGLDRTDFLLASVERRVDAFTVDWESLDEEVRRGRAADRQRVAADHSGSRRVIRFASKWPPEACLRTPRS